MKLIVGLGNPGEKYRNNRHNVGFMVLRELAKKLRVERFTLSAGVKAEYAWTSLKGVKIELFKPQTFMNNSGDSVVYAYKKHPELTLNDIYIIHDDLDIRLGGYKIAKGKGPKDHKGLLSIYAKLESQNFWHVRIGIENRYQKSNVPTSLKLRGASKSQKSKVPSGEDYVLQDFNKDELEIIERTINNVTGEIISKIS